jgi:uncharacterized protein YdhG (YjbR/CyaY superfamily)
MVTKEKVELIGVLSDIEEKQPELREHIEEAKKLIIENKVAEAHKIISYRIVPKTKFFKEDLKELWNSWILGFKLKEVL